MLSFKLFFIILKESQGYAGSNNNNPSDANSKETFAESAKSSWPDNGSSYYHKKGHQSKVRVTSSISHPSTSMESNLCRKEAYLSGKKDTLDIESLAKVSQETNTRIHNVAYNENSRIAKDILPTSNSSLTFRPGGSEYKGTERDDEISSNTSCKKQNPHYCLFAISYCKNVSRGSLKMISPTWREGDLTKVDVTS